MLCDLVCAKSDEAEAVAASHNASEDFDGISIKGIETVKLGKLHALVTKKTYAAVKGGYGLAASGGDEGPFVVELPKELVGALASLDAAKSKAIAAQWAKAEELVRDRWKTADVVKTLGAMCELARTARKGKKTLFLWMTL